MKKIIFTIVMGLGLVFSSNGQALKVAADGNVGVNTSTPTTVLQVKSKGPATQVFTINSSTNAQLIKLNESSNSSGLFAFKDNLGNENILLSPTGRTYFNGMNVGIGLQFPSSLFEVNGVAAKPGGGDWAVLSDRRLKKNIKEFTGGLKEVLQINPVSFQYNGVAGVKDTETTFVGLIAQDVEDVAPYMVSRVKRTTESRINTERNADYQSESVKEQEFLQLDASAIRYMLVNAIKEQQKLIEDKEKRIQKLEEQLSSLEDKVSQIIDNQYHVTLGGVLSDQEGAIGQNIPNPFAKETQIFYRIPDQSSFAHINIFDMHGRLLKTVSIQHKGKGMLNLTAEEIPSGTYSYQLVVDNQIVDAKKMIKN